MMDAVEADAPDWAAGGPHWGGLGHLMTHAGPLSKTLDSDAAASTQTFMRENAKILVIGAGGLGCELLKNVALSGFRHIHVIDLDTIDVTNLNRQFLFRAADVGKPKATVAAAFINARVPGARVVPHHGDIRDFDDDFYRGFKLVIAGLDSIDARRWLNATLVNLVDLDSEGNPDQATIIPLIDGGTEGLQGQARVILPRLSSCFECTLGLFPPARNFPLCTIANTPRLPEHCIEYANVVLWDKEKPFGEATKLDNDSPEHTTWLYEKAKARAEQFGIPGVTYRLTQGVTKNIIPAVAATNAVVAAACANEAVKMATGIAANMDNYMMYNGTLGVYTYTYRNDMRADCPVCGAPTPIEMSVRQETSLAELLDQLAAHPDLRCRNPVLRTWEGKTLYAAVPPQLHEITAKNVEKRLDDLFATGTYVTVTDRDLPSPHTLILNFTK